MDDFEQHLREQPIRRVPQDWRAEILAAARAAAPAHPTSRVPRRSFLSTLHSQLSALLWPHPKAWAGLAVAWVFIFAMNFSMHDTGSAAVVKKSAPPSAEIVAELKQQRLLFAELVGANNAPAADRQKFLPLPRSERAGIMAA